MKVHERKEESTVVFRQCINTRLIFEESRVDKEVMRRAYEKLFGAGADLAEEDFR